MTPVFEHIDAINAARSGDYLTVVEPFQATNLDEGGAITLTCGSHIRVETTFGGVHGIADVMGRAWRVAIRETQYRHVRLVEKGPHDAD